MRVIYCDGSDDLLDSEIAYISATEGFDTLIVSYTSETYEGRGYAIGIRGKRAFIGDIGHCSCYGCDEAKYYPLDLSEMPDKECVLSDQNQLDVMQTYIRLYQK